MKTLEDFIDENVIDSRDIIEALEAWESLAEDESASDEEKAQYKKNYDELKTWTQPFENASDWQYGETLINEDYFTQYIEELIDDCYEMPKEINSGNWPWCHVTIDYEAAANEAKVDYIEENGFLIRA